MGLFGRESIAWRLHAAPAMLTAPPARDRAHTCALLRRSRRSGSRSACNRSASSPDHSRACTQPDDGAQLPRRSGPAGRDLRQRSVAASIRRRAVVRLLGTERTDAPASQSQVVVARRWPLRGLKSSRCRCRGARDRLRRTRRRSAPHRGAGRTLARCWHQGGLVDVDDCSHRVRPATCADVEVRPPGLEPGTCRLRV